MIKRIREEIPYDKLDENIRDAVRYFNELDGIQTFKCCGGHDKIAKGGQVKNGNFIIRFYATPRALRDFVEFNDLMHSHHWIECNELKSADLLKEENPKSVPFPYNDRTRRLEVESTSNIAGTSESNTQTFSGKRDRVFSCNLTGNLEKLNAFIQMNKEREKKEVST